MVLTHANHGAAYSRNRGIRYAKDRGVPFVAFLNSDDVWHEDKLAWQMKVFELHPGADIVVVRQEEYERIDILDTLNFDEDRIRSFENLFETICLKGFVFHPASYVAKIDLFNEKCLYDFEISMR